MDCEVAEQGEFSSTTKLITALMNEDALRLFITHGSSERYSRAPSFCRQIYIHTTVAYIHCSQLVPLTFRYESIDYVVLDRA